MAIYNVNLTGTYCSHWGLWEAVREILQNAEDQETINSNNKISVIYNKNKEMLSISNKESVLEKSSLLMGESTKQDDKDTIGKFGEGYKIGLLILTVLNKNVVIKNYSKNEKWTPIYKEDKKYDNRKVLKVNIEKYRFTSLPDNNLTFEIEGITSCEWEMIKSKYLKFNTVKKSYYDEQKNGIIFDKKHAGCLYINGLFVEKAKSNLEYGYNIHPKNIEIDRDRKSLEGFELYQELAKLFTSYAQKSEENANFVIQSIKDKISDVKSLGGVFNSKYFYKQESESLSNAMVSDFIDSYDQDTFPIEDQSDLDLVRSVYPNIKTAIVSKTEKALMNLSPNYSDVSTFVKKGGINKGNIEVATPFSILANFMLEHSSDLYGSDVKDALKGIIEKSKEWEIKELKPIVTEISKTIEIDNVEEQLGFDFSFDDKDSEKAPMEF